MVQHELKNIYLSKKLKIDFVTTLKVVDDHKMKSQFFVPITNNKLHQEGVVHKISIIFLEYKNILVCRLELGSCLLRIKRFSTF